MQKRRVIQRQDVVLQLCQHFDLGTAEDDVLGPARGEAIHDFKLGIARTFLDNTEAQLSGNDSIYAPDLQFVAKDQVDHADGLRDGFVSRLGRGTSSPPQSLNSMPSPSAQERHQLHS